MHTLAVRRAARALLVLGFLTCAACTTTGGALTEVEPPVLGEEIVLRRNRNGRRIA